MYKKAHTHTHDFLKLALLPSSDKIIQLTLFAPRSHMRAGEGEILLHMRTPPIPVSNTLYSRNVVYTNGDAGVDVCFLKEYNVAVHAHYTTCSSWCAYCSQLGPLERVNLHPRTGNTAFGNILCFRHF